ncbi:MAG: efflux RND transporter permease subunit [Rikenellaceae bacterium]|nr:efflux RND transporter permease subunit [Rikenellaceae bacterium]
MNFLLNRRITITMIFVALTMLGYVFYKQLSVELLPNAELPTLNVRVTIRNDVDPAYMETQIISPLEGAISTLDGVEKIQSRSRSTDGNITVDFKNNVNLKYTTLRLQERIEEVLPDLPDNVTVTIQKTDITRMSNNFMGLQVRGSGGVDRVRNIVDEEIVPELENVDGVAAVNVYGGRQKALEVQVDMEACKALNITPSQIRAMLIQNSQERTFVGYVNELGGKYFVHVNSEYESITDIKNIVVAPGPVLLKDIAVIFFDLKEETTLSRVNGKEAVSVSLMNDAQVNLIEVSHRVLAVLEKLNAELYSMDIEIVVQSNSAEIMENNINQITELALFGGLLAIIILWIFLKNIRLVIVIALSIPISIYAAFNLFYYFGISINSLTLVGMALAVGMLLDNSIVVLENIYRLSASGLSPEKSVTQGTKEVWRSIFAATLTTVTVFLPFVFSQNYIIKLIGQHIGVSIISTLMFSLLVALLFVHMATYVIMKRKGGKSVFYEKISIRNRPIQIYIVILKTCLRNPGVTIFGSIAAFFITYILATSFMFSTVKEVDSDRFEVYVTMFNSTTLEGTDKIVRLIEERIEDVPEMKELVCRIQEREAILTIILEENFRKNSRRKMAEIMADVMGKIGNLPGVNVRLSNAMSGGNNAGGGLEQFQRMLGVGSQRERIVIRGTDYELMELVTEDLRYYLSEMEGISNTWMSYQGGRQPEINLVFDPILLNSYEITRSDIQEDLASLNQEISSEVSMKLGDETYEIIIGEKLSPEREQKLKERGQTMKTVDDLRAIQIASSSGGLHDIQSIAAVNYGRGFSQILRVNQDKQIELFYNFGVEATQSREILEGYRQEVDQLVEGYNLPGGVGVQVIHEEDEYKDFKFLIIAAFIFTFMILASVFESITTPVILLFTIPLAGIGSLLALWLTGNSLENANTLTGFLILLGVVVNNGIILIDYTNILRNRGYNRNRAIITAGLSRLRPILITSITTIIAMLPMAMGQSEYAGAIGAPFAITVIGGLAFSALLTLVIIPTVYVGLENSLAWYRSLSVKIKITHAIIFLLGVFYILTSFRLYGPLVQTGYMVILIIIIPVITYFIQVSLRRAGSKEIDPDAEINIKVRNLVKIYDWPGRIERQLKSGLNIRRRMGIYNDYHSLKDFRAMLWVFVVYGFLIYFTFFYLTGSFWIIVMTFLLYYLTNLVWSKVSSYLKYNYGQRKIMLIFDRVIFWGLPFVILVILSGMIDNFSLLIIIAVFWYVALGVKAISAYLYDNNINIERIDGRFGEFRRSLFRTVKSIPLLGKRRKPFKALKGVSFDIKTGMFGLLGPNGAGKSTMMRIICGILDQSYGTIWINGLDTKEYREELQNLIGFLPQEFGTYENMTSWEFLDYEAILKGILNPKLRKERLEYVLKAVHMYERKDAKIGSFSGGMKQRIGIALILLNLPKILVVDEPTAGLDPRERIRFRNLLVELSKERIVIFSTHIIEDISSSSNQVVVINKGELKYFGEPIDMIKFAKNKVWNFVIPEDEFEEQLDKTLVVHHIQNGSEIRVRYISVEKPYKTAEPAEPNLEDAYLCLLKNM